MNEVHPTRYHVPRVQHLAGIGPHDGLDVLRPTPPGLQGKSPRGDLVDVHYVDLAVVEGPGLVGGLDALGLQGLGVGHGAPSFPRFPARVCYPPPPTLHPRGRWDIPHIAYLWRCLVVTSGCELRRTPSTRSSENAPS